MKAVATTCMQLQDVKLSTSALRELPRDEKKLLFLAAHLCNELWALHKLMAWSLSEARPHAVQEDEARTSQALMLMRIFVAKLHEAKNTLLKLFCDTNLLNNLNRKEAFNNFIDAFDRDSVLFKNIRNKLSFHSDMKVVEASLTKIPGDADLHIYSGTPPCGEYYQFADVGVLIVLAKLTSDSGLNSITKVVHSSLNCSKLLRDFSMSCIVVLLQRHPELIEASETVIVPNAEVFEEVSISYFACSLDGKPGSMPLTVRFPPSISGVENS
jgi:hypothetical protein